MQSANLLDPLRVHDLEVCWPTLEFLKGLARLGAGVDEVGHVGRVCPHNLPAEAVDNVAQTSLVALEPT